MRIIPHEPAGTLRSFVKGMWIVEEENGVEVEVKAFPVGYPFINVISGSRFRLSLPQQGDIETASYLAGAFNTPFALHMKLVKRALTVQLLPYALPCLLGLPASEFYNTLVTLADIAPGLAERLETEVASERCSEEVILSCAQVLGSHYEPLPGDERMRFIMHQLTHHRGTLKISSLSHEANLTMRRLQQLFKENFGMSPKAYSQVIKMQYHSFELLHGAKLETIIPSGFYDQSHFIHELKKQTGMLPGEYRECITDPSKKAAYLSSNLFSSKS